MTETLEPMRTRWTSWSCLVQQLLAKEQGVELIGPNGLGLPEAINMIWELSVLQTYVIHVIRKTFRFAPRQHWDEMARDLRPVCTAPDGSCGKGTVRRFLHQMGNQVSGDHPVEGERVERIRPVPGL